MDLRSLVLISLAALLGGCASPGTPPPWAALRAQWTTTLHDKQLEAFTALYAPNADFLDPDGSHASGTEALRAHFQDIMAKFDSDLEFHSRSVVFSGALAFDSGGYKESLHVKATGLTLQVNGDYLTVCQRDAGGHWLIVQQAWTFAH